MGYKTHNNGAASPRHYDIAAAILRDRDQVLMVRQQYIDAPGSYFWTFPAGKLEAGETFLQGVVREIREETGLTVTAPVGLIHTCEYSHAIEQTSCLVAMYEFTEFTGVLGPQDPDNEVLEAKFLPLAEARAHIEALPWRVIREPGLRYFEDREAGPAMHWQFVAETARNYEFIDRVPHEPGFAQRFWPGG